MYFIFSRLVILALLILSLSINQSILLITNQTSNPMKTRRSDNKPIVDDWAAAAFGNDFIVADLLIQIRHSAPPSRIDVEKASFAASFAALRWGLRRRRSRSVSRNGAVTAEKSCEFTKFSPTTPLSWSSGGGDGDGTSSPSDTVERFCEVKHSLRARSNKGCPINEAAASISTRKRKATAVLKEEQSAILKERKRLRKELETLQVTIKDQIARNQYLKRLKVEWDKPCHSRKTTTPYEQKHAYSNYSYQIGASSSTKASSLLSPYVPSRQLSRTDLLQVEKRPATKERCFVLPDLNTLPFASDPCCSETLYGLMS